MPDHESQAHSELASFGEELRREREIRGISLREIADATKISTRFLDAIERNDHKTLPAPAFTRGFIRAYARYLGLNAEDMVNRYNYAAAGDDRIEKTLHLERLVQPLPDPPKPPPVRRGIPPAYARVDRNIYLLIVLAIALAGVSYWAFKHKREKAAAEAARAELTATAPSSTSAGGSGNVPSSTAAGSPIAAATAKPIAATAVPVVTPASELLHLTMELTGDSWITLEADGKTVVNDELKAGDKRLFEAKDGFRFKTIGNAGGVVLTLDDRRLEPLGPQGKVKHDVILDRQSLEQHAGESRSRT
jgi:cytoskeleton protein RodZ